MSNVISSIFLLLIGAAAFIGYSSLFTVDERQKALVVQFGQIQRTIEKPGLYFKWPLIEELVYVEDRLLFLEGKDKSVQVVDGRRYLVDAIIMLRIVNPQKFRETVQANLDRARDRIDTRLDAALRQTYGKRTFESALSRDRQVMMDEIRDQVKRGSRKSWY